MWFNKYLEWIIWFNLTVFLWACSPYFPDKTWGTGMLRLQSEMVTTDIFQPWQSEFIAHKYESLLKKKVAYVQILGFI